MSVMGLELSKTGIHEHHVLPFMALVTAASGPEDKHLSFSFFVLWSLGVWMIGGIFTGTVHVNLQQEERFWICT